VMRNTNKQRIIFKSFIFHERKEKIILIETSEFNSGNLLQVIKPSTFIKYIIYFHSPGEISLKYLSLSYSSLSSRPVKCIKAQFMQEWNKRPRDMNFVNFLLQCRSAVAFLLQLRGTCWGILASRKGRGVDCQIFTDDFEDHVAPIYRLENYESIQ
jgi:hypothetical protein